MLEYVEDIPNPYAEPHALVALEHPLTVEGQLAIELMSGDEAVSLGLRLARIPNVVPWDTSKNQKLDVLLHAHSLVRVNFAWRATPCKSMTLARELALRSLGLPNGRRGLSENQRTFVELGNALAFFCIDFCLELMEVSAYWAFENPHRSFVWVLLLILMLWNAGGGGVGVVHFTCFVVYVF